MSPPFLILQLSPPIPSSAIKWMNSHRNVGVNTGLKMKVWALTSQEIPHTVPSLVHKVTYRNRII